MSYFRRGTGDDGDKPSTVESATMLANAKPKGMFDWFTDMFAGSPAETPPIIARPPDGSVILYPPTGPGAPTGTMKASSGGLTTKQILIGAAIFGGAVFVGSTLMKGRR